jgi:formyl-CoA transferase
MLNLGAATPGMWVKVCELLDLEHLKDHPDYADNTARAANRDALREIMNQRLSNRRAIEWTKEFIKAGVPAGPVYTLDQVFEDPQVKHLGLAEEVKHPVIGSLRQLSNPLRMENIGDQTVKTHPPLLGEHSAVVLREFNFGDDEIAALIRDEVVLVSDAKKGPA